VLSEEVHKVRMAAVKREEDAIGGGLYKLNPQLQSARFLHPCAYEVKTWFKPLLVNATCAATHRARAVGRCTLNQVDP
jgi:hypothetical protein